MTLDGGRASGRLHAAADLAPAPDVMAEISRIGIDAEGWSRTTVNRLPSPLSRDQLGRETVGLLRDATGADGAFLLAGLVADGLPAGTLSRGLLHGAFPYAPKPAVVNLKGIQLLELLERAYHPAWQRRRPNFLRGRSLEGIFKAGIEVHLDPEGRHCRVRRAKIRGKPVRLRDSYRIASSDFATSPLAGLVPCHLPSWVDADAQIIDILQHGLSRRAVR